MNFGVYSRMEGTSKLQSIMSGLYEDADLALKLMTEKRRK